MEHPIRTLSARNVGDLLSETFSVYGGCLWSFMGMVAVVQVPFGLLTFVPTMSSGYASGMFQSVLLLLNIYAVTLGYAAGVYGVCQVYLTGKVSIQVCYMKAIGKARTLAIVTGVFVVLLFLPVVLALQGNGLVTGLAGLMLLPVVVLTLYWSFVLQVVMVEKAKYRVALRRSFDLVKGSLWRVFGISVVLFLVVLGLRIVVNVPFAVLEQTLGIDIASGPGRALSILATIVAGTIALPVLFIFSTLFYYDLRVRKEEYSFATMSTEVGIVSS